MIGNTASHQQASHNITYIISSSINKEHEWQNTAISHTQRFTHRQDAMEGRTDEASEEIPYFRQACSQLQHDHSIELNTNNTNKIPLIDFNTHMQVFSAVTLHDE